MAKKDFTGALESSDPTLRFISTETAPSPKKGNKSAAAAENNSLSDLQAKIPEGYKIVRTETRSKRMHIVVTPTIYEKIKSAAGAAGLSQNEYINQILEKALIP